MRSAQYSLGIFFSFSLKETSSYRIIWGHNGQSKLVLQETFFHLSLITELELKCIFSRSKKKDTSVYIIGSYNF